MNKTALIACAIVLSSSLYGQRRGYWQQHIDYDIQVQLDVDDHTFSGTQNIRYQNNSPDTLDELFFHLYFNAFAPGSMMDERSQSLPDPDRRVGDRIAGLKKDEIGFHRIEKLLVNGSSPAFDVQGTLMRVELDQPLLPGSITEIQMSYQSQVPKQIRRSGRDNKEGVEYTMTQWYPKMAEYSDRGWHTQQYVNREFFGVYGNYDVRITLDSDYILAGTGVLQNACDLNQMVAEVYCGREVDGLPPTDPKQTWHFRAERVHDFAWAADDDFVIQHEKIDSTDLYFVRLSSTDRESWELMAVLTVRMFEMMNEEFGRYPYPQFSVIQGGDGGMEYPMCTMVLGNGAKDNPEGFMGLVVHESVHSWYYGVLGFDEQRYAWMDEGFTTYAEDVMMDKIFNEGKAINPHGSSYRSYNYLRASGWQEPLTTPADHFSRNRSYSVASYSMGSLYLAQLEYIVGKEVLRASLRAFYEQWKFAHPGPDDLLRIIEKKSGMQLHWFSDLWTGTTQGIDYALEDVRSGGKEMTALSLKRNGDLPMPLEIRITTIHGDTRWIYVPTDLTTKPKKGNYTYTEVWPWTRTDQETLVPIPFREIQKVEIDPYGWMADTDPTNNDWTKEEDK